MKIQITKKMKCTNVFECSDKIIEKLETNLDCKLKAENINDNIHGHVSIIHLENNHIIDIVFYDKNEKPNKEHDTTFKKINSMPNSKKCEDILNKVSD